MRDAVAPVAGSPRHHFPSALRHVLSNWVGLAWSSLIALFLSPFIVHHLGNDAYGLWILANSLTLYLSLFNLGVSSAVVRYVARFHADENDEEANAVISAALAIFLVVGIVAILASFVLAALLVPRLHIPEVYQFALRTIVVIGGCNVAFTLVSGVFGGILTALHRFDMFNLVAVVNSSLTAIAVVIILSRKSGVISLALVYLFFAAAATFAYAAVAFRLYPALRIRIAESDREHLKLIFSFSNYAFLLQVSFNLIFYTDSIIIGRFLSVSFIAFFAIAGNLIFYSRALISGISSLMTPRVSVMEGRGDQREVQKLTLRATRFATVVVLPIALTFLLRGSTFIRLWMGPGYGELSGRVLLILTFGLLFFAADHVATAVMLGMGKHRIVVLAVLAEAVCNLALSIALVRRMGIIGVAWGTTLPSLAVSLLFWPWYLKRVLNISIRNYAVSTWLRPAIAMIPFGLLTFWIERMQAAHNLAIFFGQIAAILPVALLACWYLCFDLSERKEYRRQFMGPILKTLGWV